MRAQSRHYTDALPFIGHNIMSVIKKLTVGGQGWQWDTTMGKLVIAKDGDRYLVLIGDKRIPLSLVTTQAGYGVRYWYSCPYCHKRRANLYYSGKDLACRECWGLHYASQGENSIDRLRRKVRAGRYAIWGYSREVSDITKYVHQFRKPKGMRWAKFDKLVAAQTELENHYWQAFCPMIEKLIFRLNPKKS